MPRRLRILVGALLCVLTLIAGAGPTSATSAASGFPLTFENCGDQVTIASPPERVVLMYRYITPLLEAVGGLDNVVAKAREFPPELYDVPVLNGVGLIAHSGQVIGLIGPNGSGQDHAPAHPLPQPYPPSRPRLPRHHTPRPAQHARHCPPHRRRRPRGRSGAPHHGRGDGAPRPLTSPLVLPTLYR